MARREVYEFGEFTLDASERQLSKGKERVPLAPKEHDVLVTLLRSAGRLVTKTELLQEVWPESFVEEGILSVHISALRKALGVAGPRFIEIVPRSGYRFVGTVARQNGKTETPSRSPEVYELIGRARSALLTASMFDVPKAIAAFLTAIESDPSYAPAHAGLALAHCAEAALRLVAPV